MLKSKLLGCLGIFVVMVGAASAQPISYQGHLFDGGVPAQGLYDLECRLFDAALDGVQLGQTVVFDDLLVNGGLLNIELDFEYAFDDINMFFEISMRPGASVDLHDVLLPRQQILPAPTAINAIFSVFASNLTGTNWSDEGVSEFEGGLLVFGEGDDRAIINRPDALNADEFFGVHVTSTLTGGIFVSNEDALGVPSVSYAVGGAVGASHSYAAIGKKGSEVGTWVLDVGGSVALEATSAGVASPQFRYPSPATQAVTVAGDVFHSALGEPFTASFFSGGAFMPAGSNSPMVAPITLPHGAIVTGFTARFEDNFASEDIIIALQGATSAGSLFSVASVTSAGASVGIQSVDAINISKTDNVIDTFNTGYYLRAFSSGWPADDSLRIWSVTVKYTVVGPS